MGFSSWECNGCGHPLLSEWVTTDVNAWMKHVVVVTPKLGVIEGRYDGYAHLENAGMAGLPVALPDASLCIVEGQGDPCVWHRACWNKAGQPTDHKPSTPAMDQGYFFNHATGHQMEDPK